MQEWLATSAACVPIMRQSMTQEHILVLYKCTFLLALCLGVILMPAFCISESILAAALFLAFDFLYPCPDREGI